MLLGWLALWGCGDPLSCKDCEDGELCVAQLDEASPDEGFADCFPVPAECGDALDCQDNTCLLAAFGLCAPGSEGSTCDPEGAPALTCQAEP